jgi:aspartyl-tRNA(Asn)/glutamyl-tRNA(Gln) amidotransferase subunit B
MKDYTLTVGLEVHAELNTRTKMFCDSRNSPDEKSPNVNVCPVCMSYPGTLPVINKEAVRSVLLLGAAVGGEIADYTEFDRKNYFYPDIPKGYQISQYKHPLVAGGSILGINLTRIHLEEDTAKSTHNKEGSLVDFNRAGVPLMELVTEPEIHDAETAGRFARELQLILTYLGIAHANMEKGEMRVEANISVSKTDTLGTKVEVKNLNSFKAVEKAIKFEYERQIELLESGGEVKQETRGWDENKGETFSQRAKEESHDYRYFPDPDLPKLYISEVPEFSQRALRSSMPELPQEKRSRLLALGISEEHAENYVRDRDKGEYFEKVVKALGDLELVELASNYITTDLKVEIPVDSLSEIVRMAKSGEISSRAAKDILKIVESEGGSPRTIAEERDLLQKSNEEELVKVVEKIINANPDAVAEYKKGKLSSLQFLIGQGMKETKGSANPQVIGKLFVEHLA